MFHWYLKQHTPANTAPCILFYAGLFSSFLNMTTYWLYQARIGWTFPPLGHFATLTTLTICPCTKDKPPLIKCLPKGFWRTTPKRQLRTSYWSDSEIKPEVWITVSMATGTTYKPWRGNRHDKSISLGCNPLKLVNFPQQHLWKLGQYHWQSEEGLKPE